MRAWITRGGSGKEGEERGKAGYKPKKIRGAALTVSSIARGGRVGENFSNSRKTKPTKKDRQVESKDQGGKKQTKGGITAAAFSKGKFLLQR